MYYNFNYLYFLFLELKNSSKYLLLIFLVLSGIMVSQNETKKWYFGYGAGLNFSNNPPTPLALSSMSTTGACSSISDNSGNLIFYTGAGNVYNSSHTVIPNGSGVGFSANSWSSNLILKKPGSTSIYYIFNVVYSSSQGFNYSIVDMSLAAGQGSVTVKNQPLVNGYVCDKLTATKHCNGTDYWVVVRDLCFNNTNCSGAYSFMAYQLSAAGISTVPVNSPYTYIWNNTTNFGWYQGYVGQMKISPNGKKLACANYGNWSSSQTWTTNAGTFELYDFDISTGVVSNSLVLMNQNWTSSNWNNYGMGAEFSPDCTKLYGSLWYNNSTGGNLFQWDLCAGSPSAVAASIATIANTYSNNSNYLSQLQMASDGKIYCAQWWNASQSTSISVINNPNNLGSACNFSLSSQSVAPGLCYYKLPNFSSNSFLQHPTPPPFTHTVSNSFGCQSAAFSATAISTFTQLSCAALGYSIVGLQWNFGDPASGSANTATITNPIHAYTTLGTYTAQLVIQYSCGGGTDTLKQTINVNQPCISVNSTSITCSHLGSATVQATGGIGPFSYTWMPTNQTNSVATGLSPGTYTLTVFDFGNNFTYTATTTFNSLIPLTGNLSNSSSITCNGAATGTAAYTGIAGGSTLQIYSWTNGVNTYTSTNPNINTLSAGVWSSTVTDALTGCTLNNLLMILQPPALTLNIAANTPTACAGSSIALTGNVSGGSPGYTYAWQGAGTASLQVVSQAMAGPYTYTLNAYDTYGCVKVNTVGVNFIPNPTLTVSNPFICPLQTASLTVSGAGNYTWNPSSSSLSLTGSSFTVSPNTSQFYSVIGESLACTSIDSGYVSIKPLPNPMFVSNIPVCEGKTLTMSCNSGTAYVWTGPNNFTSTAASINFPSVALNANGVYNVTVTALNSCTAATSGTVLIKPLPSLVISPSTQSLCVGLQTVNLTASGTGTSYTWSPNQNISNNTAASIFAYPSVTKIYTATAALNACTTVATATVYVVSPPSPYLSLSSQTTCAQALNGSPNNIVLTPYGATSYTLLSSPLFNNSNPNGPVCPLNLSPPYTFSGAATATLLGSNGVCTLSNTAVFSVVPNPSVLIVNATPTICAGENYTFTASGAMSYTWNSLSAGATINGNGYTAVANTSAFAVFSVYGEDKGCFSATKQASITVNPLPQISISPNPTFVCLGNSTSLTANGNATSFLWSPVNSLNFNSGQVVQAHPVKQETYTVLGTLNNCTATAVAVVSVMALPQPSIFVNKTSFCLNEDLDLSAAGALYYHWVAPNKLLYQGQKVHVPMNNLTFNGQFTLTAIDSNACEAKTSTNIQVWDLPSGYLRSSKNEACVPFCSNFQFISNAASSGSVAQFSWKLNNKQIASAGSFSYCFNTAGTYSIKGDLSGSTGCFNSVVLNLKAYPKPKADFSFTPDKPIANTDEVYFEANQEGISKFNWSMPANAFATEDMSSSTATSFKRIFPSEGAYPIALVVSNAYNCVDTVVRSLLVYPDLTVFVPSAFTPNGDHVNDTFYPVMRAVQAFKLEVFDRWGEKVFETSDINHTWDGNYHGEACKSDVYVWKLKIQSNQNNVSSGNAEKLYAGDVTLIR